MKEKILIIVIILLIIIFTVIGVTFIDSNKDKQINPQTLIEELNSRALRKIT